MKHQVDSNLITKVTEHFIELQLKESPTSELYLRTLIGNHIISFDTMKQYCIVKDYDTYLRCNKGVIKDTLYDLSDDYNLFHGHIRKIHRKFSRLF